MLTPVVIGLAVAVLLLRVYAFVRHA